MPDNNDTMQAVWKDEDTGETGTITVLRKATIAEGLRANGIDPARNISVWAADTSETQSQHAEA
jgi:hypothetical protein